MKLWWHVVYIVLLIPAADRREGGWQMNVVM